MHHVSLRLILVARRGAVFLAIEGAPVDAVRYRIPVGIRIRGAATAEPRFGLALVLRAEVCGYSIGTTRAPA
jgi:hypothetical protein